MTTTMTRAEIRQTIFDSACRYSAAMRAHGVRVGSVAELVQYASNAGQLRQGAPLLDNDATRIAEAVIAAQGTTHSCERADIRRRLAFEDN